MKWIKKIFRNGRVGEAIIMILSPVVAAAVVGALLALGFACFGGRNFWEGFTFWGGIMLVLGSGTSLGGILMLLFPVASEEGNIFGYVLIFGTYYLGKWIAHFLSGDLTNCRFLAFCAIAYGCYAYWKNKHKDDAIDFSKDKGGKDYG